MRSVRAQDDISLGRLLTRREALALIGASGVCLLAGSSRSGAQALPGPAAQLSCIARPQQTEGPFFVDEALERSDIRSDPRSGEIRPGVPLRLTFRVSRLASGSCAPLAGAQVDLWQCDATGRYSDVRGFGPGSSTPSQQFLRGNQLTDTTGSAQFLTIYPGAYGGRAVHVHFKIRTGPTAARSYAFTSQLYFDEAVTERVYAREPYASQRRRWLRNAEDSIFRGGGRELTLTPVSEGDGYAATFDIGLQV
jgi:protocatechuate 3,4-dioxygenase beta subunit